MQRRSLGILGSIFLLLVAIVIPTQARADMTKTHTYVLPKQRHGDARILVDPGVKGLPGGLKIKQVLHPDFRVKFAGQSGFLWITVHPPSVTLGKPAIWKGKRVALTLGETNLPPKAVDAAIAALSKVVASRERAWGWMWRPKKKSIAVSAGAGLLALSKLHRDLAAGESKRVIADILKIAEKHKAVGVSLAAARLLHGLGDSKNASRLVAPHKTSVATRVVRSNANTKVKSRQVQLLGRVLALSGDGLGAKGTVVQLVKLGHACSGVPIAKDLALAGDGTTARDILEHIILKDANACHLGHALLVDLLMRAGKKSEAEAWMKRATRGGPQRIVSHRARLAWVLANGSHEQLVNASYAAQIQASTDPVPFDIAVLATLIKPPTALQVRLAKERARGEDTNHAALLNAATLCVASGDYLCVEEYLGKAASQKSTQPYWVGLKALHALRMGKPAEAERLLEQAWTLGPDALLPIWIETEKAAIGSKARAKWERLLRTSAQRIYQWSLPAEITFGPAVVANPKDAGPKKTAEAPPSEGNEWLWVLGLVVLALGIWGLRRGGSKHKEV